MMDTLKRLLDNATQGTWSAGVYEANPEFRKLDEHACVCREEDMMLLASCGPAGDKQSEADIDLIVYLVNTAPKLLELWEAAEKFSPFAPIVALEIYRQQARTAGTDWDENKERQIIIAADNLVDALNALKEQELNDELPRP